MVVEKQEEELREGPREEPQGEPHVEQRVEQRVEQPVEPQEEQIGGELTRESKLYIYNCIYFRTFFHWNPLFKSCI